MAAPVLVPLAEPLTSSSRERMQALVDMVTGEALGQHFEQVLFISHNHSFDATAFAYHIYVDNGLVAESNLPVVVDYVSPGQTVFTPLPEVTELDELIAVEIDIESDFDENDGTDTAKVPVPAPIIAE